MRLAPIVALSLLLSACGGDEASPPPPGGKADASKRLTPAELAEAMGRRDDPQAIARELEASLKAQMGTNIVEDARKAKAFGERPLTTKDVETYLELAPLARTASGDLPELRRVLATRGLSQAEWGVLSGRMMQVRMLMRLPSAKVDAKLQADVETVRPYAERLDAASKSR